MNIVSVFISVLFFYGLYQIIPNSNEYIYTIKYATYGAFLPYIISLILNYIHLKRISIMSRWFILYLGLFIYSVVCLYITNEEHYRYIMVFSLGSLFSIIISIITGTNFVFIHPFKEVYFNSVIFKYITVILITGVVFLNILLKISFDNIYSIYVFLIIYFASVLLLVLNMDFIDRLIKLLRFVFKVNIKEVETDVKTQTINVLLKELSPLWTKNKAIIDLQNLANSTWLNNQVVVKEKEWLFNNDYIRFFWLKNITPKFHSSLFKDTVGEFLSFLDKNGNCPSVVKEQEKNFGKYGYYNDKDSYNILYEQTLIDHILQLCDIILKDKDKFNGVNLEKMILTALGHDLGKIVGYQKLEGYKTGDHPNASVALIENNFEYFKQLDYGSEVIRMIKNHHASTSSSTPLLNDFKEYDSKARRLYLNEFYKKQQKELKEKNKEVISDIINNNNDNKNEEKFNISEIDANKVILEEKVSNINNLNDTNNNINNSFMPDFINTSVNEEVVIENKGKNEILNQDIQNTNKESNDLEKLSVTETLYRDITNHTDIPDYYKISSFFDIKDFIKNTAKKINIIDKGRFSYITVNGDMVLCYTGAIVYEIKKSARQNKISEINNLKDNEISMSFTEYCRKLDILHTDWIQEGYFQGNFLLCNNKDEVIKKGRYIPLRFDAFQDFGSYEEFELRKKGELEEIISAKVATKEEME